MLDLNNWISVKSIVHQNINKYLPKMIDFKEHIQRAIIPLLSPQELSDIRDSRLNKNVIRKLAELGKKHYCNPQDQSDAILYCICLSIGTIIKEYGWGTKYISQDGMCELASLITTDN